MIKLKSKLKRMLSFFTTFVLVASTLTTTVMPVTTFAADKTVQDAKINRLDKAITQGYGHFNLESDSSGYEIEHSKNLTKAKKTGNVDWIWQERDQGNDNSIKNLGNAYIAPLTDDTYWIQYNGIKMYDNDGHEKGTYDVRAVFDNPKGSISGADGKDIAVFDGQLGAVRFRGYKSLDCSIYIYEHGTKNMVSGDPGKLHLRFIDIDCNQAIEILTPGRVDWAYREKKISWAKQSKCNAIGATYGNTVWFEGDHDEPDDNIQSENETKYKSAKKYTFTLGFTPPSGADTTFKVRYYAGGVNSAGGTGSQKNGAFFSFDGNLDFPDPNEAWFSADVSKQVNGTTDATLANAKENFTYTLNATIAEGSTGAKAFTITDTLKDVLQPVSVTSITKDGGDVSGNFDTSINGQTVTVSAKSTYLATNPTGTISINISAKIKDGANLSSYKQGDYFVIPNTGKLTYTDSENDTSSTDSNEVTVRVPLAELTLDKVADKYEYKVGDTVTYTITTKNVTANATAYNVVMTDTIPSDLKITGVTTNKGNASHSGQNVSVSGADLAYNESLVVKVTCEALESGNTKELYNTAQSTCWNIKNPSGHADDDAETYINTADLAIDKTVDKYEYEIGDKATFTVKVKNDKGIANNVVITDNVPEGMTLDYDSVKISGLPASVERHVAGTPDPTNQLDPNNRNQTEVSNITAEKSKSGENGWKYTINYFPAGAEATITFTATANEKGNGKESQNVVSAVADNAAQVQDDAEFYVNTAKLTIDKKYINPYKDEKNDNRCDNEYRIYEEETGFEKVQYEVIVKSAGDDGTVAKNVIIDDVTLPEGLALNYQDIVITETAADGTVTKFEKASGGNGTTFKYKVAGTADETNKLNPEYYNETEDHTPEITIEKSGNGFIIRDTYLQKGAYLTIKYDANALENETVDVNGTEITNTATATADNLDKDDNGKNVVVKDDTTVYINSPRLKIVKKADSGDYEIGDNVSYTIDVINTHVGTIARNLVFTDELQTPGVEFLTGTIELYDTEGYALREGTDLAGEDDYTRKAKSTEFTLTSDKHLVVDGNYDLYDLANGKNPEEQGTWNPPYVGVTSETKMTIKYDMKITDKDLAGKDIDNVATAVSDEALKVTDDETVKPDGPNLTPDKEVDVANPVVGQDVTFTLRFTNQNQNTTANNVKITDFVDSSNMVKIYEDSMKVTYNNKDVTKDVKVTYNDSMDGFDIDTGLNLTENDTIVVTYRAKVLPDAADNQLTNTTGISAENAPEWKYDSIPIDVPEEKPNLEIEKVSDKKQYSVGETGHYTVKVTQTADDQIARNVVIKDALENKDAKIIPDTIKISNYKGKDVTDKVTITADEAGYTIETGMNLAQNEFFTVTYDVSFESASLSGETVPNTAQSTAENHPDPVEDENEVEILKPDLDVTKTSDKKVYSYKEIAHYTVETKQTVKDATAFNVVIEDEMQINGVKILPDTIKIADNDGKDITGDVKITASDLTYRIETGRDLAYNEKFTVTYDVEFVDKSLIDQWVPNVVIVTADNASGQAENEVTPELVEEPNGAKYEILKSCEPASGSVVNVGDEIVYTITVNNVGDLDLKDVLIKDPIPEHVEYVSGGDLTQIDGKDTVVFRIDSIKVGESADVTFTVKVVDEGLCEIVNVGYVKANVDKTTTPDDPTDGTTGSTEETTGSTEETTGSTEETTGSTEETTGSTEETTGSTEETTGSTEETTGSENEFEDYEVTGTDADFEQDGFHETNQVVHYVPYRVQVVAPEITIEKTSDKTEYNVGDTGEYTVIVTQVKENATAIDVHVKDALETEGAKIVADSIRVYDNSNKDVTAQCTIETTDTSYDVQTPVDLAQGEQATVKYQVLFESADLSGKQVRNVAKATTPNLPEEDTWVEDDNVVNLAKATLSIEKDSDRKTYAKGETGEYEIVVRNTSNGATAKQVIIDDSFDKDGVKIKKNSVVVRDNSGKKVDGAKVSVDGNALYIETGIDLAPGEKLTVSYEAKFSKKGKYTNTAVASSQNTDPVQDTRTVKVTKTGISPVNVTPDNIVSGSVKTGDVLSLLLCVIIAGGALGVTGYAVRRRKRIK